MQITSPITNSNNTKLIRKIKTSLIINNWGENDVDVERFFKNMNEISLHECLDSGYKFYYPLNLEGDNQFYKDLQIFPWYYFDWKWEYDESIKLIKNEDKVLEIGCGQGDFIKKLKDNGTETIGLEFNDEAIEKSRKKNLTILKETIQEHANNNKNKYDVICSFQVMEHIADIKSALQASVDALKIGGKLIISVPNNDSFLKKDIYNLMNMPPHHVGLWDEKFFKNLEEIFNIKLIKNYIEPLQTYHYRFYYKVVFGNKINKIFGPLGRYINITLGRISLYLMVHTNLPKKIKGHTIMAVYTKK